MIMWQFGILLLAIIAVAVVVLVKNSDKKLGDERLQRLLADEMARLRREHAEMQQLLRLELQQSAKGASDSMVQQLSAFAKQLSEFSNSNEQRFDSLRAIINEQLEKIRAGNELKLDEMNKTVNEKLHNALETRLKESFAVVGERLEAVHKGLGEMQKLAADVGGLQRVLTNVKTRGMLGENQLAMLLEQVLSKSQYAEQVVIGNGRDTVDFAVKLPSKDEDGCTVLLPMDAKFPVEDYQRLIDAQQIADMDAVEVSRKALITRIKFEAKSIAQKYINPPQTTDFAILYLPSEGLYAEVLSVSGLQNQLQTEYHVVVVGPSTLYALLNSLHMGFRTLAIERKSAEMWKLLGAVKTEFGKFEKALSEAEKKIQEAGNKLNELSTRSRAVVRQVKSVEALDEAESSKLLELDV